MYQSRHIVECLIELLAYPRELTREAIDPESCPHGGYFDDSDRRCRVCFKETECRWLDAIDWGADTSSMSASELLQALEIAISFINQYKAHHDRESCDCQTCSWLRDTRHLIKRCRRLDATDS